MKYSILLILAILALFAQPAYSVDLDKDGIPDDQDQFLFDYDNDGMPDEWEKAHGLRWDVNDARLDQDNDGISNLQEYRRDLIRGPPITERLKGISTETILLILLIIGIAFVVTGIALHLHKKRKESKPAEQPRPANQRPTAPGAGRGTRPEGIPPESTPIKPLAPK